VALAGFGTGVTVLGLVATGFALAAAFLNAAFGFCLGCELYLLVRRAQPASRAAGNPNPTTNNNGAISVAAER
jgi:zinc transporter ZupT